MMRLSRFIFGLLTIYYIIETTEAVTFKLTNAVCDTYNKSWVMINQCRLKAVKRDMTTMNLNVTLLHPANYINLNYQVFKRANGYKPWLMKGNVDICRFLKKNYGLTSILIFNLFKDFTNFNSTCPLVGDHLIKDFYLRAEMMPLPLPTGDYMLSMSWSFVHKLQFETNVSFTFVEDLFMRKE